MSRDNGSSRNRRMNSTAHRSNAPSPARSLTDVGKTTLANHRDSPGASIEARPPVFYTPDIAGDHRTAPNRPRFAFVTACRVERFSTAGPNSRSGYRGGITLLLRLMFSLGSLTIVAASPGTRASSSARSRR